MFEHVVNIRHTANVFLWQWQQWWYIGNYLQISNIKQICNSSILCFGRTEIFRSNAKSTTINWHFL